MQPRVVAVPTLTVDGLPWAVTWSELKSAALSSAQALPLWLLPDGGAAAPDVAFGGVPDVEGELPAHPASIVASAMIATGARRRTNKRSRPGEGLPSATGNKGPEEFTAIHLHEAAPSLATFSSGEQ